MLIPSSNLNEWIEIQNKQLRTESDIKIEFFDVYNHLAHLIRYITKKDIETFNIQESASILGFETPSVDINFTVFKDENGEVENAINDATFIRISYGFKYADGTWGWVVKGAYEISKVRNTNNGMTISVEAKFLRYQAFEQEWIYGGTWKTSSNWLEYTIKPELKKFDNDMYVSYDNIYVHNQDNEMIDIETGCGSFTNRTILSLIVNLFQAFGYALKLDGYINNDGTYGVYIRAFRLRTTSSPDSTYTIEYRNELKKYEIVDEDYFDAVNIYEQIATFGIFGSQKKFALKAAQLGQYIENPYNDGCVPSTTACYVEYQDGTEFWDSDSLSWGNGLIFSITNVQSQPSPDEWLDVVLLSPVKMSKIENEESGNYILEIDNPFIAGFGYTGGGTNHLIYNECRAFFNDWKTKQQHIELNVRFDPRLEILDTITYGLTPEIVNYGIVENYSMSYNGSYKASLTIRELGLWTTYTATFYNAYGDIIKTERLYSSYTPTPPSSNPTKEPSRVGTQQITKSYTFVSWNPAVSQIFADTEYNPTYTLVPIQYQSNSTFNSTRCVITHQSSTSPFYVDKIADIHALINNPSSSIPSRNVDVNDLGNSTITFPETATNLQWANQSLKIQVIDDSGNFYITNGATRIYAKRTLCVNHDTPIGRVFYFATEIEISQNELVKLKFNRNGQHRVGTDRYENFVFITDHFALSYSSDSSTSIKKQIN